MAVFKSLAKIVLNEIGQFLKLSCLTQDLQVNFPNTFEPPSQLVFLFQFFLQKWNCDWYKVAKRPVLQILCFLFYRTYKLHPNGTMRFWEAFARFQRLWRAILAYLWESFIKKKPVVQISYPLFHSNDARELSANNWPSYFTKLNEQVSFLFVGKSVLLVQLSKKVWNRM